VQASQAAVRGAPRTTGRGSGEREVGGNSARSPSKTAPNQQWTRASYTVGLRFEWDLFRASTPQQGEARGIGQREAEHSLPREEEDVRQSGRRTTTRSALEKQRPAAALLEASDKSCRDDRVIPQHGSRRSPTCASRSAGARRRRFEQAARAEAWSRAAAFAVEHGYLDSL